MGLVELDPAAAGLAENAVEDDEVVMREDVERRAGSPVVLLGRDAVSAVLVAIVSSPADPFGVPCTGGSLQYRVDTEGHRRFIDDVIRSVDSR
jgi:hypothetical protein